MKNIILLFLFLIPVFLFAQYPTQGNKSRLGYQTTGDGLIWRGVAADTAIKPRTTANAYFQLDTVNRVLRRYIATQGSWQVVGGTPDLSAYLEIADTAAMLSNYTTFGDISTALGDYLPLQGGTLTGTGGAGFLGLIAQSGTPSTPASGFKMYANGAHNLAILDRNGWITTFDISAIANRDFTYPSVGGTFALGTGTADRSARWSATNTLAAGNFTDNGTKVQALLPFQLHQWTTAGRPTGVTGYEGYNTSDNGPEWYQGSRWAKGLESTANRFASGIIPYADANGQMKGSYSDMYLAATELVVYRAPYFSSNQVGIAGGIRVYNTNTTSASGYGSIALYPSTGGKYAQFFCTNTLYPGYGVITAQSFGHYSNGPGGMAVQSDDPTSSIRFGIGTTGKIEKMRINSIGVGVGRTAATAQLEVDGAAEFHGNSGIMYVGAYGASPPDASVLNTGYIFNTNTRFGIFSGAGASLNDDILFHATSTRKVSIRAINDTISGIGISLSRATFIRERLIIAPDSTFKFNPSNDVLQLSQMGQGAKEAADLSKTQSNYIAGFATDGTVLDLERKRDTTIFVTADTDYDFSAAVTTAQIASRYNRIIIHMTLTSGVGADKTTTLHTPDANLMQCEILIRGTDNTGSYDNEINFGTNNAISSDGTNASGYTLAQGQGLHVRVVYNGSAYKYIYY